MLSSFHIENIAVVKKADIPFERGFTALTGETGAGKSIIIDAISLLLGARPSREMIRTGEKTAMVSAYFTDLSAKTIQALQELGVAEEEDGTLLLQRNIGIDGRAQTKLNGRAISVALQREIGKLLFTIHGQHDNQALLQAGKHILFLDAYADLEDLLQQYEKQYGAMKETQLKIMALSRNEQEKARLIELLKYQIADIDSVKLREKEEETLLQQRAKIQNSEKITKQVKIIYHSLYQNEKGTSAIEYMEKAISAFDQISSILPAVVSYREKLSNFRYEMEDIALSVRDLIDMEDENPTALLNKIETRLESISRLKHKYGTTIEEILKFRSKAALELEEIELSDEKIEELQKRLTQLQTESTRIAKLLTEKRILTGAILEQKIMEELTFLEMSNVRFSVAIQTGNVYLPSGMDTVEFLISTNPGEPLKPLHKIASGGELSRIMLAMKSVLSNKESTGTLIFDEIDTGVSGKTSQKIGVKLKQIAQDCQVVCVTHSAQIAALAHNHLLIQKKEQKGRMETRVVLLSYEKRIQEIARIMGGIEITDTLLRTAKELLDTSTQY